MSALSGEYNNVIELILAVTKPTDIKYDDVCAKLLNEATCQDTANVSAVHHAGNSNRTSSKTDKLKKHCGFCLYTRHTKDECRKKAAAEARRQRDLKKFGKQVQVAKLQQRAKEKRDTMEKINTLKKSELQLNPHLRCFHSIFELLG